jgi:hypothetical protein
MCPGCRTYELPTRSSMRRSRSTRVRITDSAKYGISSTRNRKLLSVMADTSHLVLARVVATLGDPSIQGHFTEDTASRHRLDYLAV